MKLYTKGGEIVQAFRWDGNIAHANKSAPCGMTLNDYKGKLKINSGVSKLIAIVGDWIVTDYNGKTQVIKDSDFNESYSEAGDLEGDHLINQCSEVC